MQTPHLELSEALYRYPRGGFSVRCEALKLYPGELSLIVGKNGSGKTTLSKMLCGICRLQSGRLLLQGQVANEFSLGAIGKHVGYLFQNPEKQLFSTSVWEELTYIPLLLGQEEPAVTARAQDTLALFGLEKFAQRSPYRLSRGEKQRLALCALLMQGASHLILDEPTTGLDKANRAILHETLRMLLQTGIGISVITHDHEMMRTFEDATLVRVEQGVVCA